MCFPGRKYLIGEFYRDGQAAAVPERSRMGKVDLDEENGILLLSENLFNEVADDPDIRKCAVIVPWLPDNHVVVVRESEWEKMIKSGDVLERRVNAETET